MHYCFLIFTPLFLHSLASLVSNSVNLPFGTQGKSMKEMKPVSYKKINRGHEKYLYLGGYHRVLPGFTCKGAIYCKPLLFIEQLCTIVPILCYLYIFTELKPITTSVL